MDVSLVRAALDGFEQPLRAVQPSHWQGATPCAQWDVRTLVNHVVNELLWVPPLLEGATIAEVGDRFDGDLLADDAIGAWTSAATAAIAAASAPGAQERTVHLSFGDFPGGEYLGQVTTDVVIHSWDLARAIGANDRLDAQTVDFADRFLAPQLEAWRGAGAFGPAAAPSDDADVQDRLLAATGRSTSWSPPD